MEQVAKTFKLYSYCKSSATWRVRIAMNIQGLKYEYVPINLLKDEQQSEAFTKINPNQSVPALDVDGQLLIQSVAIIEYLEEVFPEVPLFPKDPLLKSKIRGFVEIINSAIQPMQNLRLLGMIDTKYKGDKAEFASFWVTRGLGTLEELIKQNGGQYCFGDDLTIADCYLVPQVQGAMARFNINIDPFPNLKKVFETLKALKPFQDAQPSKQPDFVA